MLVTFLDEATRPKVLIVVYHFTLQTDGIDGSAETVYTGQDELFVESNVQVGLRIDGNHLSNGRDTIITEYRIDGDEQANIRNKHHFSASHTLSATARLSDVSDQSSGVYRASITLTVIALHPGNQGPQVCPD